MSMNLIGNRLMKDITFGDRMKMYEKAESGRRFMPLLPVYARIDGRSFSRFTKGFNCPYDERMTKAMVETTKYLVNETNALIGYTQSDEISLAWYSDSIDSQIFFDGKIQKMVSVLAAMTSVKFNKCCQMTMLKTAADRLMPVFDCRVFQLPNKMEATNALLWREQDATKNAISMAARSMFGHKQLMGKNGNEMQEMMWQEHGVNFNDYPDFFKRGTFVRREPIWVDVKSLPEKEKPAKWEGVMPDQVQRHKVLELDMPKFSTVTNRVEVIFDGADPIVEGLNEYIKRTNG